MSSKPLGGLDFASLSLSPPFLSQSPYWLADQSFD
jgi:hypothetical protein